MKSWFLPLNRREKLIYPSILLIILSALFSNLVIAEDFSAGTFLQAPASQCSSINDDWIQPEQAYGDPNVNSDNNYSQSNSAISNNVSGELICTGFDVNDRKAVNGVIGVSLAVLTNDELSNNSEQSLEKTELQLNSSPTRASISNSVIGLESNITENNISYDNYVAQIALSNDGNRWTGLYNISEFEISNFENRLYVQIPKSFAISNTTQIKITSLNISDEKKVLVDSLFLGYEVGKTQTIEIKTENQDGGFIGSEVEVFSGDIDFVIKTKPQGTGTLQGLASKISGAVTDQSPNDVADVSVEIESPENEDIGSVKADWLDRDVGNYDVWKVHIESPQNLKPGVHTAIFSVTDKDGFVQSYEQDFMWGVLAMNTDKDIYKPSETANLEFAVLDNDGYMVCDADVTLQITGPNNYQNTLSTENEQITVNEVCESLDYTETPDYQAQWQIPDRSGLYNLSLTATTNNGTHAISHELEVNNDPEIVISRTGPTRIYPPLSYPVTLSVDSRNDFNGKITEVVPNGFELLEVTKLKDSSGNDVSNEPTITEYLDKKYIKWENTRISAGTDIRASYVFDAPNISPEFWLLGPIELSGTHNYKEARTWQIASDAIGYIDPNGDGTTLSCTPTPTGTQFTTIDDGTRQPTAPNTSDFINCPATGSPAESFLNMSTLTASNVSALTVWVYHRENSNNMRTHVGVTQTDELTYIGAVTTVPYSATYTWSSVSYTGLSLNQATLDALKLQLGCEKSGGPNNSCDIASAYIEVTYTNTISVSGTTNSTGTVRVAFNGTLQAQSAVISAGSWSITGLTAPTAGTVVTVWVDGAAEADESTAVTKYSGSGNVTGMVLNRDVVTIGSTSGQSLTVTDLGQYDADNDEDIVHTANASVLNVTAGGHTNGSTRVLSGNTLTIGGTETFTTHDVIIDGTLISSGGGTFTVTGSWDNNSIYTKGTETITFTSTTAETIDSTGATTSALHNVTLNGSGGTWTNNSAHTLSGNLVVTAGTLNGTNNFTVNGGAVTGNGTINMSGGTFLVDGAGNFGGNTAWTFSSLTFGDGSGATTTTSTGTGNISVNSVLTIAANQTLIMASKTWFLNGSGTPFVINGTFNAGTSTVEYNGSAATNIRNTTYYNLSFKPTSGSPIHTTTAGTITVANNLVVGNGTNAVTLQVTTNDTIIDINGNFTVATSATYSASDTASFTIASNFTNNGTFTHNNGTTTFDTTNTSTITGDNTRFYNFTTTTANKTLLFSSGQNFGIDGLFTITGTSGNDVHIHSTVATSQWFIDYQGTNSVSYAHIQDSGCKVGTQNLNLTTTTNTNDSNNGTCWFITNVAPNAPSSLAQRKTDDSVLATGDWTNENSVKFTAQATDPDNPDTLELCIEIDLLGTGFSNTEDSCGTGVAYSGSAVSVSHTISGLADGSEYHWQARIKDAAGAYSAWVSYDVNLESARDVGVDTSAPSGGAVYDGTTTDVDIDFNNGDLDNLSANWSGINSGASGLSGYEYSIGTSAGATDVVGWTANGTTASITVNSLNLNTSAIYFYNVRTTDNAGNQSTISSDGQRVAPTLTFSSSPGNVTFDNLNSGNSYTSTKTTTLTTSTNAYNGYVIRAFVTGLLTSQNSDTIGFFDGGTYAAPDAWLGGDTGYGYTSNDNDIQGANLFNPATCLGGGSSPCYAPFSTAAPGDIVADHTALVSGSPIINENFIITHRVTTLSTQPAGTYTSEVTYVINAIY